MKEIVNEIEIFKDICDEILTGICEHCMTLNFVYHRAMITVDCEMRGCHPRGGVNWVTNKAMIFSF